MPRAIWSGSIAFGLVNAPVRLYSAIAEHRIALHLVHTKDGSRIGYQKVCKKENEAVPDDEVAKAYESDGKVIVLEPEDFAAAQGEGTKTIEVLDFVPHEQIDPIYFERTFYLGPEQGARERLLQVIRQKKRGRTIAAPEVEQPPEAPDLLAALRESVERARGGPRQPSGNGSDLEGLTVAQLGKRAAKLGIEGRSKMSKRDLVAAIEKAED